MIFRPLKVKKIAPLAVLAFITSPLMGQESISASYELRPQLSVLSPRDSLGPEDQSLILSQAGGWTFIDQPNPGTFPLVLQNRIFQTFSIMTGKIIITTNRPSIIESLEDRFSLSLDSSMPHLGVFFLDIGPREGLLEDFPHNLDGLLQDIRDSSGVVRARYEILENFATGQWGIPTGPSQSSLKPQSWPH